MQFVSKRLGCRDMTRSLNMATTWSLRAIYFLVSILFGFVPDKPYAYHVDNNPYHHIEILDQQETFLLEWLADWEESRVIFNVTVNTKGYVGLGLSRKGKMSGADIVIGGVLPSGQPYFSDRHAIANEVPVEDPSQDWTLHSAWESDTHTFLSFSRPFETCDDDHDLPIHDDVIGLLWAFGEKDDDVGYHYQNRGVFYSYLLDPDLTPRELKKTEKGGIEEGIGVLGDWKVWRIAQTQDLPAQDTAYVCSIYKVPVNHKHHIVGFRSIIPTDVERRHIHHYLLHRCIPPVGQNATRIFQPLLGTQQECYQWEQPMGPIPTQYCTEIVHVWAVGQRPVFFPDHVGLPMYPNEYYMLQTHFDNPDGLTGYTVRHALEIFHTDNLRKHDAAVLAMIGSLVPGSPDIMIPPNSLSHEIYGHCGSGCTERIFPPTGIKAFASFLHTHLAGRGIRRIHIRDGKELPYIAYDDNYNFNYQQIRIHREERLILPGDTIVERCVYDNTYANGNVTVGGFSTRNEMCSGMLWYYDKLPEVGWCASEIRSQEYRNFLQIYNTTWSNSRIENVVTSPSPNAGLVVSEVGNERIDWTIAKRQQLQELHRNLPQVTVCPSLIINEDASGGPSSGTITPSRFSTPRIPATRPPLLPLTPLRRAILSTYSSSNKATRRNSQALAGRGLNSEIQDPETEFISVYPQNIVKYERPSVCARS